LVSALLKYLLLVLLLIPGTAFAQKRASVSGSIKDARTGEVLIGANVGLLHTPEGASSDTTGYFSITHIKAGSYTLIASYIGYQTYKKQVELSPGQHLKLQILLKPQSLQLGTVVVESERKKEKQYNLNEQQIQAKFIKKVPAVFSADVFRSLQLLPGVKAASELSSGLYIRGGSPDQTLILLDGATVYNPSHFFGFFSVFNPDAIKDVHLYKGTYPAKYGSRLGSVLAIDTKSGSRDTFGGTATVGLLASRAEFEGPLKKGSWMVALRRSTLDPVLAVLRGQLDNIPNAFYFHDINGKFNYRVNSDNTFSLSLYAGLDDVDFPIATDADTKLHYGNQTFSANWTHAFSDKVSSNLKLTGSHYFDSPTINIASTIGKRPTNIFDYAVKEDLTYQPNSHHTVSAGFKAGWLTIKHHVHFQEQENFSLHIQSPYASIYLQDEWSPSKRWTLTPGLRINSFGKGSYRRLGPRFSVAYHPTETVRLQASYGRYDQFLTQSSILPVLSGGFTTWFTTARGVPPEYGDQFSAGIKATPLKGYGLNVVAYYRTMRDLFQLNPFLPDKAGIDYNQLFRFGRGYAYGLELSFKKQIGRLTGRLGYTFSITRRKYPHYNYPIGQPGQVRFFPPKYGRRHDLKAVVSYKWSPRWKATAVFHYATGQPYTKALGRAVSIDFPFLSNPINQLVVGKVNASRMPAYHRLDIGFTRSGTFFGLTKAQWQFQVINVYSHRNIWFYDYDFDKNPVERNAVKLLPVLPNISYTINF
jgi:outer membrane receptor protein involved in Fe transport